MIHIGGVASHLLPIHDGLSQIPHKAFLGSTHTTCLDVSSETKTGQQIRPAETSFDNGQSGGVHPSANDKKPSNIQVELE